MTEIPHFIIQVPRERINRDESKKPEDDDYFCADRISTSEKAVRREEVWDLLTSLVAQGLLRYMPERYTYDMVQVPGEKIRVSSGGKSINIRLEKADRPSFTSQ